MTGRTRPALPLSRRAALTGAVQAVALLAAACAPVRRGSSSPTAAPAPLPSQPPPIETAPVASPSPTATVAPTVTPATTPLVAVTQSPACPGALAAVIPPTPVPYPGYTEREPSTGLHVTAKPQIVDLATYRLTVDGKVARELSLTYDEIRCLPKISTYSRIECPGFFVDWSNLAGASLSSVLALARPLAGAERVEFTGADGRKNSCPLIEAQGTEYFLAYEWEGEPLPISHGFPVRAALTNNAGGYWIKWLQEIRVS